MHRLSHIGRAKIDHDFFWRRIGRHTESFVMEQLRNSLLNRLSLQGKVDETGARDTRRLGNSCDVEFADDALRYLGRILAALFLQHHRGVALVIAKALIGWWRNFPSEWHSRPQNCLP